jgi:Tfp pilus assembly protein FimT
MVLAIIGVVSAFAIPSMTRYRNQEEVKEGTARVAGQLRAARSQAMKTGVPHFVLFWPNPNPTFGPITNPTTVMVIVRDTNGNFQLDAGETTRNVDVADFRLKFGAVTGYNQGQPGPHGAGRRCCDTTVVTTLAGVPPNGTDFQLDTFPNPAAGHTAPTNLYGIGFTTRGIPVDLDRSTTLGSGAGIFYMTDNQFSVYAVSVGGLGEIRVRTYVPTGDIWR